VGAARLRQDPKDPLPLRQLIFLNQADDIRVWFLTNSGPDLQDLIVIESQPEDGAEDAARAMKKEEAWFDEDECRQGGAEGGPRAPPGAGVIVLDNGGVSI